MALFKGLATFCLVLGLTLPAGAATIDFDDIADPGIIGIPLSSPYQGFDWTTIYVYEFSGGVFPVTDLGIVPPGTIEDPKNAVYTDGDLGSQISRATPFSFVSAYLGGFIFPSMGVTVQGFLGGSQVATALVTVDDNGADQFFFTALDPGFGNVDTIKILGVSPACDFNCLQVTMDNFEYDAAVAVPEPATLLLVGTGLAAARIRRRYRRRT